MNVSFIGRLGKDAEVAQTKNGKTFVKFSVAENIFANGEKSTQWINCIDFRNSTADKLVTWLKKGSQVFVVGECRLASWEDKNGVERNNLECVVSNIKLAGSVSHDEEKNPSAKTSAAKVAGFDDDDDIPF